MSALFDVKNGVHSRGTQLHNEPVEFIVYLDDLLIQL